MIPKDIYICHKNMEDLKHYSLKWVELNPDMNIHLYDNELCVKFLSENFPPVYTDIFNFIKDGPIKSDFWRLCILYVYGGCYVDADIEPFVPLSSYVTFDEYFVTCLSCFDNSYNPHFIMCEKHNKIIGKCIGEYIKFYTYKFPYSYGNWSIVHIMNRILNFKINNNKSGEFNVLGKKMRFLKEQQYGPDGRQYCNYMGHIVLSNRYQNYKDHRFMTEEEIKNLKLPANKIPANKIHINKKVFNPTTNKSNLHRVKNRNNNYRFTMII